MSVLVNNIFALFRQRPEQISEDERKLELMKEEFIEQYKVDSTENDTFANYLNKDIVFDRRFVEPIPTPAPTGCTCTVKEFITYLYKGNFQVPAQSYLQSHNRRLQFLTLDNYSLKNVCDELTTFLLEEKWNEETPDLDTRMSLLHLWKEKISAIVNLLRFLQVESTLKDVIENLRANGLSDTKLGEKQITVLLNFMYNGTNTISLKKLYSKKQNFLDIFYMIFTHDPNRLLQIQVELMKKDVYEYYVRASPEEKNEVSEDEERDSRITSKFALIYSKKEEEKIRVQKTKEAIEFYSEFEPDTLVDKMVEYIKRYATYEKLTNEKRRRDLYNISKDEIQTSRKERIKQTVRGGNPLGKQQEEEEDDDDDDINNDEEEEEVEEEIVSESDSNYDSSDDDDDDEEDEEEEDEEEEEVQEEEVISGTGVEGEEGDEGSGTKRKRLKDDDNTRKIKSRAPEKGLAKRVQRRQDTRQSRQDTRRKLKDESQRREKRKREEEKQKDDEQPKKRQEHDTEWAHRILKERVKQEDESVDNYKKRLKKAYLNLAKEKHPDKNPEDREKATKDMQDLNEAALILGLRRMLELLNLTF